MVDDHSVTDGVGITDSVSITMRSYFSTHLLFGALDMSRRAQDLEDAAVADEAFRPRFDQEHRYLVLGAVVSSVNFLEAAINELYSDAADGHGLSGAGYLAPLDGRTVELMREWWVVSSGKAQPLDKFQMLLVFAGHPRLPAGQEPVQSTAALVKLRNTLVHYQPEDVTPGSDTKLDRLALNFGFDTNQMMKGSGNPTWPDHVLGAGCARWAFDTAVRFADHVFGTVGVNANYQRVGWHL